MYQWKLAKQQIINESRKKRSGLNKWNWRFRIRILHSDTNENYDFCVNECSMWLQLICVPVRWNCWLFQYCFFFIDLIEWYRVYYNACRHFIRSLILHQPTPVFFACTLAYFFSLISHKTDAHTIWLHSYDNMYCQCNDFSSHHTINSPIKNCSMSVVPPDQFHIYSIFMERE